MEQNLKEYILYLADNSMILGQRLGEWCGHGPVLEQDIALTNIALDLIGEARNYYQYLAETEGKKEDDYPMFRDERQFRNVLLVEQPNGNWADTMVRQFLFDCWHYYHLEAMTSSANERLSAISKKSIKEANYHLAFSSEWFIRLGDGTQESHDKMQAAVENLMPYFDEFFIGQDFENLCFQMGVAPDLQAVADVAKSKLIEVIEQATITLPEKYFVKKGGKSGLHTENLGFILAEMQYMQRAYPGLDW
mgnify:CR=1 FL=1